EPSPPAPSCSAPSGTPTPGPPCIAGTGPPAPHAAVGAASAPTHPPTSSHRRIAVLRVVGLCRSLYVRGRPGGSRDAAGRQRRLAFPRPARAGRLLGGTCPRTDRRMDLGRLLLRLTIGTTFFVHGTQKL